MGSEGRTEAASLFSTLLSPRAVSLSSTYNSLFWAHECVCAHSCMCSVYEGQRTVLGWVVSETPCSLFIQTRCLTSLELTKESLCLGVPRLHLVLSPSPGSITIARSLQGFICTGPRDQTQVLILTTQALCQLSLQAPQLLPCR